jgi:hypothetical protein
VAGRVHRLSLVRLAYPQIHFPGSPSLPLTVSSAPRRPLLAIVRFWGHFQDDHHPPNLPLIQWYLAPAHQHPLMHWPPLHRQGPKCPLSAHVLIRMLT